MIPNTTLSIASDLKYGTLFMLPSQWEPIPVHQWSSNFPTYDPISYISLVKQPN